MIETGLHVLLEANRPPAGQLPEEAFLQRRRFGRAFRLKAERPARGCEHCLARCFVSSLSGHIRFADRSEEHTSELQSRLHLVCRLLLEKKKNVVLRSVESLN